MDTAPIDPRTLHALLASASAPLLLDVLEGWKAAGLPTRARAAP